MKKSETVKATGGIGFFGWLTLIFITLKLTGYIDWSWWWVLSPMLIPIGILLGFAFVMLVLAAAIKILGAFTK